MSNQIPEAFVKQYSANVMHLSQQKGSRLAPYVRRESQKSESKFFDRIGAVVAQKKVGRHSDTVYSDTPHSRRRVTLEDYFYSDLCDEEDKLRIIQSPESEYAIAAMNALGRAMDDVIIAAALGDAYSGVDGGTSVSLPNTQKLCAFDGSTTTGLRLNVQTLRAVKKKFNQNEVEEGDLYFAITAEQLDGLLGETEVTSSDYASVKALVQGDVDSFMGFKFIRSERLLSTAANQTYTVTNGELTGALTGTLNAGADRCFAFKRDGLILSIGKDMMSRIDEMPGKHYAKQVYAKMGIGSTRLEEVKVVEVLCDTP